MDFPVTSNPHANRGSAKGPTSLSPLELMYGLPFKLTLLPHSEPLPLATTHLPWGWGDSYLETLLMRLYHNHRALFHRIRPDSLEIGFY